MDRIYTVLQYLSVTFLLASFTLAANGQMVIDADMTPEECVQDVLLGEGVSVSNITFNGQPGTTSSNQIGYFDATNSNIPIPTGVIMATSGVEEAESPNDGTGSPIMGPENPGTDPDLQDIIGDFDVNDEAVLEFDFVPQGDSVVFSYVFASEEYNEYVCSSFNDAFGFFISGPGINGPYENNAENLAIIPGTDIPVGINTVNQGTDADPSGNCESANPNWENDSIYFINSEFNQVGGFDPNPDADSSAVEYDGFTVVLAAIGNVQCGETYHIKMAIADATDNIVNSAVFLESESFTSNAAIQVELQTPVGLVDSTLYEGCGYANLIFTNPGDSSLQTTAYLDLQGTLENGVDFQPELPDSIVFEPFQEQVVYQLTAPNDNVFEGNESMTITIENIATTCDGTEIPVVSDFTFNVNEADPLDLDVSDYTLENCNDTVEIGGLPIGGYGAYDWQWSNGATDSSLTVSPGVTTDYTLTLSDTCDAEAVTKTITVNVPEYPPVTVDAGDDFEVETCDTEINLSASVNGGFGTYQYDWIFLGDTVSESPGFTTIPEGQENVYVVWAMDACGETASDTVVVTVPPVEMVANAGPDRTVTDCRDSLYFDALAYGGIGDFSYEWYYNGELVGSSEQAVVSPVDEAKMELVVTDECDNSDIDSAKVNFDLPPLEIPMLSDTTVCKLDELTFVPKVEGGLGEYDYSWSGYIYEQQDSVIVIRPRSSSEYNLTVTDECNQEENHRILVNVSEPRARFAIEERFDYYEVQVQNQSSEGEYFWDFGDGGTSTEVNPRHTFTDNDRHFIVLTVEDQYGCTAVDSVQVTPPMEIFIPNSFTPNGDGRNDLWGPVAIEVEEYELTIIDRWGRKVFHTKNIDERWNGTYQNSGYLVPSGAYNYFLRVKGPLNEEAVEKTGTINVIR